MKTKLMYLTVIFALVIGIAGCQPAPAPTEAPPAAPTSAPAPTQAAPAAPTSAPAPTKAPTAAPQPFVIALAGPMTGDGAQQGQYAMSGAEIARDEINAAGGINGQPIQLLPMDDKGDPAEGATVAQRLVDDKTVQVVMGHLWSSATLAAEPIYIKAGMPVITPSSSNVKVTNSGFKNILRMCTNDAVGAPPTVAQLVNNLKAKKIAVIFSNDDYGRGYLDQVKQTAEQLGAKVVYEGAYKPNVDKDFTVQLTAAVAAGADSMLLGTQQTEGGLIVSQASQMGIFDKIQNFVGGDGLLYQVFLDRMDKTAEPHVWIVAPYDPFSTRPNVKKFVDNFQAKQNATPSETAWFTYDILYMIKDAYAAGATRETLIDKIKTMTFTDLLTSDKINFNEKGDRSVVQMFNIQVKDHKFVSTGTTPDLTGVVFSQ